MLGNRLECGHELGYGLELGCYHRFKRLGYESRDLKVGFTIVINEGGDQIM